MKERIAEAEKKLRQAEACLKAHLDEADLLADVERCAKAEYEVANPLEGHDEFVAWKAAEKKRADSEVKHRELSANVEEAKKRCAELQRELAENRKKAGEADRAYDIEKDKVAEYNGQLRVARERRQVQVIAILEGLLAEAQNKAVEKLKARIDAWALCGVVIPPDTAETKHVLPFVSPEQRRINELERELNLLNYRIDGLERTQEFEEKRAHYFIESSTTDPIIQGMRRAEPGYDAAQAHNAETQRSDRTKIVKVLEELAPLRKRRAEIQAELQKIRKGK